MNFFPIKMSDIGFYNFQVTISDGNAQSTLNFELEVYNTPPYFIKEVPSNLTMKFNNSFTYTLPPFKDDESNPIFVIVNGPPLVSQFISIKYDNITFYPELWSMVDEFDLEIILTDTNMNSTTFPIKLTVVNMPPFFIFEEPKNINIRIN